MFNIGAMISSGETSINKEVLENGHVGGDSEAELITTNHPNEITNFTAETNPSDMMAIADSVIAFANGNIATDTFFGVYDMFSDTYDTVSYLGGNPTPNGFFGFCINATADICYVVSNGSGNATYDDDYIMGYTTTDGWNTRSPYTSPYAPGGRITGLQCTADGTSVFVGTPTGIFKDGVLVHTANVKGIAKNHPSADRVVYVDDLGDINVLIGSGTSYTLEYTHGGAVSASSVSVNSDCSEISYYDATGSRYQSITRSGTTWSQSTLDVPSGFCSYGYSIGMSPSGDMLICNDNDVPVVFRNTGGTWAIDKSLSWTPTQTVAGATYNDSFILWSSDSTSVFLASVSDSSSLASGRLMPVLNLEV